MEADLQSQSKAACTNLVDLPAKADGPAGRSAVDALLSGQFFPRDALTVVPALAAGLALRLWMLHKFFEVNGDALIYGGLAKNLLLHGRYALTVASGEVYPTLIRLPGYSLFLALCFRLFGMENYFAAPCVQIALELAGCLLLADCARRNAAPPYKRGAALATLWLAALCPFTASYSVAPLTEANTLFCLALALGAAARFQQRPRWSSALAFTVGVTFAALLRPDGALVGVALAPALLLGLWRASNSNIKNCHPERGLARSSRQTESKDLRLVISKVGIIFSIDRKLLHMVLVCFLLALTPFVAWTVRNYQVFHVFEPLAPRYATDPGESTNPGWIRWVKSWCLDFDSTYDIYWNVPDGRLDLSKLPSRAFDSPEQQAETVSLAGDYNSQGQRITPDLDARFQKLAEERFQAHPLRTRFLLPLGRLADMTFRPRIENLPIDMDWWVYSHHRVETRFSWAYAVLNALYLLLALAGLLLRPRLWPWMLAYLLLRSALLLTVEAPEARYTFGADSRVDMTLEASRPGGGFHTSRSVIG